MLRAGCPRVAGDDDDDIELEDFDDEFQIKKHHDDQDHKNVFAHSVITLD